MTVGLRIDDSVLHSTAPLRHESHEVAVRVGGVRQVEGTHRGDPDHTGPADAVGQQGHPPSDGLPR